MNTAWKLAFGWIVLAVSTLLLIGPATAGDDEVVCFGDSATAGAVDLSFPDYLEFFIDPGDGQVVNEGESGETTDEGYWRILWMVATFQHYDAKVWTYWEGGNDLIDWVEETDPLLLNDPLDPEYPYWNELQDELERIKFNIKLSVETIYVTGAEVVLGTYYEIVPWLPCSCSPIGFFLPVHAEIANHYQSLLNEAIREVADELDAPVNDMENNLGPISGHLINYHDCNHMNAMGNFWVALSWWIAVMPYL